MKLKKDVQNVGNIQLSKMVYIEKDNNIAVKNAITNIYLLNVKNVYQKNYISDMPMANKLC